MAWQRFKVVVYPEYAEGCIVLKVQAPGIDAARAVVAELFGDKPTDPDNGVYSRHVYDVREKE